MNGLHRGIRIGYVKSAKTWLKFDARATVAVVWELGTVNRHRKGRSALLNSQAGLEWLRQIQTASIVSIADIIGIGPVGHPGPRLLL